MDDPNYHKEKYFNAAFEKQTYLNLLYTIVNMPVVLVFSVIILLCFVTGLLLLIVWVGVPFINLSFIIIQTYVETERKIFTKLTMKTIPPLKKKILNSNSQLKIFLAFINDKQSWKQLLYLIIKLPLSTLSFILTAALFFLTFLLIYTPFNAMFGHIHILNYQTDSFIEAIIGFFIGIILWVGILNVINLSTRLNNKLFNIF